MRHAIANALYALAGLIDRRTVRVTDYDMGLEFGDQKKYSEDYRRETTSMNFHSRPETQVTAQFKPGHYTYAALTIGNSREFTVFMNRRFTRRLIDVLKGLEGAFDRFGEDRP